MSGTPSLKLLLDLYQKCKARGEWASLFLVTKDGKDLITFRIGSEPAGVSAETGIPAYTKKAKTPSQI